MNLFKKFLIILLVPMALYSHTLLLNVFDNDDGTMSIEGVFNTGESAEGAMVKLIAKGSEEILFQKRLADDGELVVKIPKVPYQIFIDGGPGHSATKEGIPPKGGFIKQAGNEKVKKKAKKRKSRMNMSFSSSPAVNISIAVAFILLFATMLISIYNTNKILKRIKN